MAIAVFLAVGIIASILTGIFAIFGISSLIDVLNNNVETMNYTKEYQSINSIIIDIAAAEMDIRSAEVLKIEGTNIPVDYKFKEDDGVLKISNKKVSQDSKLVIYIPNNMNKLQLDIGAGKIQMEDIRIKQLDLDTGAANTEITNLIVTSDLDIDMGVGDILIENSDVTNLDLDAGVGSVEYDGYLRGTNNINCGVGNLDINLQGTQTMYKIMAERGIGELKINGTRLSGNQTIGEGSNVIKISGGIGSLSITY